MKIVEHFLKGKLSTDLCEDGYIVTDNFVAVIDGASSKTSFKIDGMTTGKFIMSKLKEIIPTLNPYSNAEECIKEINKKLIQIYKEIGIYNELLEDKHKVPSASMGIYSKNKHQVWLFGDGQLLVDKVEYTNELKVDELTRNLRKWMIEYYLSTGITEEDLMENDLGREAILPFLKTQHVFNGNNESNFGYSSINGFTFLMKNAKIISLDKDVREFVLSSDGYPKLFSTLEETENYLQECLEEDPLCYKRIVATKGLAKGQSSYDDRCYLKIQL